MISRLGISAITLWLAVVLSAGAYADHSAVSQNRVALHYRIAGSGSPAVFLSGGPGLDVDYMVPVGDFLPTSFARIFYEQRGTGRSLVRATPETMTLSAVVEDLETLRVELQQERLFLVGHSWGGMLAMAYAAAHPDRVDRLILIGPGGPTLEFGEWLPDNVHKRLHPEDLDAERYWKEAPTRGVDRDMASLESIRAITPGYFFDRASGLAFAARLPTGSMHAQVNELLFADMRRHYDSRPGLRLLNRPVLIVQGHQDPIGDRTAEEIHATISGSTLRFVDHAGHYPWLEQPDDFRKAIDEFLVAPF